jgi:hypothetical protein
MPWDNISPIIKIFILTDTDSIMHFAIPALIAGIFMRTCLGGVFQVIDEDRGCKIYTSDVHGCTGYSASFATLNGKDCSGLYSKSKAMIYYWIADNNYLRSHCGRWWHSPWLILYWCRSMWTGWRQKCSLDQGRQDGRGHLLQSKRQQS